MFFTKEDLEKIKSLVLLTKSIKESYDELINLEINGKQGTEEYKNCIERLKVSISLETSLYDKLDIEDCKKLLFYLRINEKNGTSNDIEAILNQNKDLIISRIIIRLERKMTGNLSFMMSILFSKEELDIFSQLPENLIKQNNKKMIKLKRLFHPLIFSNRQLILQNLVDYCISFPAYLYNLF